MKILIVEDDAILGELLREYLQRLDHEKVEVCITGGEARAVIEEETFDCAFVDLRLPDTNGLQLLEAIKRQDPSLPVVMMSGYPTMEYTIEAMRKGAIDFLTKPFTLQDVALTLARVTKERKLLLENLSLQLECQARKELETVNRELEEKVHEQIKLFEISREIDEIRSSEDLYPRIVNLASRLASVKNASFFVMPPEQSQLMLLAHQGMTMEDSPPCIYEIESGRLKELFGDGPNHVFIGPDQRAKDFPIACYGGEDRGMLSCWPLRIRGELFGFLAAYHNGEEKISSTENKLLDFLIKKASLAIENMALYESLVGNFYGILKSLVNALEAKDLYTGKHSERVTGYAIKIARRMGCNGAQVEALQTVGYLHDIGKIGINDRILNKPSALTGEEYEIVKKHPTIGEAIVAELGLSADERSIIRHHHERWDGMGYPDGLAQSEIPLLARIISVADSFDAMTSKRAYRDAMSIEAAIAELKNSRGRQFDPEPLDAFVEVVDKDE